MRKHVIWTGAEAVAFFGEPRPHRLYALFYTVAASGLRHGEVLALRWDDVQVDRLHVPVFKAPQGARVVGLTPDVRDVLDRHRAQQQAEYVTLGEAWAETGLVFTSDVGTKLNQRNVTRLRHRLEDAAGVAHATMHDLRHLNVSLRRKQGQDVKLVADQIGRTDPAFTVRLYTHLFEEKRQNAGIDLREALGSETPATDAN